MKFTYEDQIAFTKFALSILNEERTNEQNIETVLRFGELMKKYADEENAVIYDITEYVAEQLRLIRNEDGAYDDVEMKARLDALVQ